MAFDIVSGAGPLGVSVGVNDLVAALRLIVARVCTSARGTTVSPSGGAVGVTRSDGEHVPIHHGVNVFEDTNLWDYRILFR